MTPTEVSSRSLRTMLGLIARDLGIEDHHGERNPVELTREIRGKLPKDPENPEDNFTSQEQGLRTLVTLALREFQGGGNEPRLELRLDQIRESILSGKVIECLRIGTRIAPGDDVPPRDKEGQG